MFSGLILLLINRSWMLLWVLKALSVEILLPGNIPSSISSVRCWTFLESLPRSLEYGKTNGDLSTSLLGSSVLLILFLRKNSFRTLRKKDLLYPLRLSWLPSKVKACSASSLEEQILLYLCNWDFMMPLNVCGGCKLDLNNRACVSVGLE